MTSQTFLASTAGSNPHITAFMERKKPPPFNQPRKVVKRAEEDTSLCYPKQTLKESILLCVAVPPVPLLTLRAAGWPHSGLRRSMTGDTL